MSWLGDLGGSISSITGQLTNFTKEVISEGREEVSDHVTELSLAQHRTRELEIQCTALKKEVDNLHGLNKELEERAHASEIQINSITREYRNILKEKEDEVATLHQQHSEMQQLHEKILAQPKGLANSPGYQGGSSCAAFHDMDEMEFGDVISSQHEINRLSDTVRRLRAERDHWKRLASSASTTKDGSAENEGFVEGLSTHQLEVRNKELERRLNEVIDNHQKELTTLHDVYEQKISQLKRSYQQEIETRRDPDAHQEFGDGGVGEGDQDLQRCLREKERTLGLLKGQLEKLQVEKRELEQNQVQVGILQEAVTNLRKSEADLREQLKLSEQTIQSHESLISQLKSADDDNVLKEKLHAAEQKIAELLHERHQASNSEMLLEVQLARHKFSSTCDTKEMQLLKEKQDLANKMAVINAQSEDTRGNTELSEQANKSCSAELKELLDKLGNPEHQQLIGGLFHALELENDVLKEQNLALQKQIMNYDTKRFNKKSYDSEDQGLRRSPVARHSRSESVERSDEWTQQMSEFDECETMSLMSSYSELSQRNKELDEQLKTLQNQIETHQRDIEHFEMVEVDWQVEKQAFGQLIDKLKSQLRAKESSFTLVTAQKGLLELKKQSPRTPRAITEGSETGELNFELELEKLQEQIEELSESSVHLENERDLLLIEKENILDDLYKANKLCENLKAKLTEPEKQNSSNDSVNELKKVIGELEENISVVSKEKDNLAFSLEELDTQHQAAIEQILESRTEMQEKCKKTQNDLQGALAEIQSLKNQNDELNLNQTKLTQTETELKNLILKFDQEKKLRLSIQEISSRDSDILNKIQSIIPEENDVLSYIEDLQKSCKKFEEEKIKLITELENIQQSKTQLENELESTKHGLESLQPELVLPKDDKTRSDWDVESWEDIVDDKNGKENNLIKSTTKLQDLELESTSSKHSKDSSDDGQEKYGELVQRKEDLEIQVKELEVQISELVDQKEKLTVETKDVDEMESKDLKNYKSMVENLQEEIFSLKNEQEMALNLKMEVEEKNKQIEAMNNILKVYKENFDLEKVESENSEKENYLETLKEKENEIQELKNELNKKSENDTWWTTEEYRNLQREREQILSVLDEKSRENSSLKTEVHRLTNIVSAERSALDKLQQDTQQLLKEKEMGQAEATQMSKEAVQSLSRIIRDKEFEIEALNQKNNTLITILHQTPSSENNRLEEMMTERENLSKQLGTLMGEREQIITALNQKHQESVAYHAEIQRLSSALRIDHEKFGNLEMQHSAMSKQYEEKQKVLINTQNELIELRQRVTELEQQQLELKGKYAELMDEDVDKVEISRVEFEEMGKELSTLRKLSKEKDEWLYEKDKLLGEQQVKFERVLDECRRKEEDVGGLKRYIESLNLQVGSLRGELESNLSGMEAGKQRVEDATSETNVLKETNSRLTLVLQEKDFEITAMKEKILTLTQVVEQQSKNDSSSSEDVKKLLRESESVQQKAQEFQLERDQVLMTLNQKQQENKQLFSELQSISEREQKLHHELERLRVHLLQVEESYTQEAVHAEEREKELRNRLAQTEDRVRNAASSYTNASYQANIQVESLQQQLHTIVQQRDEALQKLDRAEDQTQQLTASLQTFQVVLEQFQLEKERDISQLRSQYEEKFKSELRVRQQYEYQIHMLEQKVQEAKEALAAASRLSETLDQRDEVISSLKREVSDRDASLKKIQEEMRRVASSTEGKVDRTIIKNLLVNYFSIPIRQQPQVLKIIATVLDFNYEERVKTGMETSSSGGWISNWLGQTPAQMTGAKQRTLTVTPVPSLSAAFIQFLQTESNPSYTMKLPAEAMAQEITKKNEHKMNAVNPFAISTNTSSSFLKSSLDTDTSHLLMKPMTATLPVFTPLPVSSPTSNSAPNILRDVLKEE